MLRLSVCVLLAAFVPAANVLAGETTWDFARPDHGWTAAGEARPDTGGLKLGPDAALTHRVELEPGVQELTVEAKGEGTLVLSIKGTGIRNAQRAMRLGKDGGTYGLLFEKSDAAGPAEVRIGVEGPFVRPARAVLKPADEEQQKAWAAAQRSLQLYGYLGTDPQRPAPGAASSAQRIPTAEEFARFAITEKVIFLDPDYDDNWVENGPAVADFFVRRGFVPKTARQMAAWMQQKTAAKQAHGSSALFVSGMAPEILFSRPWASSVLAHYVQAGGRVVWAPNFPLFSWQGETGPVRAYGDEPAQQWLGLSFDRKNMWGMPEKGVLGPAGRVWGLEEGIGLSRPLRNRGLHATFVTDASGDFCGSGMVNFCAENPLSGFIWVPDMIFPGDVTLLRNLYRLATWSGTPVQIPEALRAPGDMLPFVASLRFGTDNARFCYLRGEQVPLVLRVQSADGRACRFTAEIAAHDDTRQILSWKGEIECSGPQEDKLISVLDLRALKVGTYAVTATVALGNDRTQLRRELRIAPAPDHEGTHVALWVSQSPKRKRTEDLLGFLKERNLEPMFTEPSDLQRDLALAYGLSFSVRHHGNTPDTPNPPGYDNFKMNWGGQVAKILAEGDKRDSRGYASPFRRAAEAAQIGQLIAQEDRFPAFRRRAVTGDDWSQWFGVDYNRYAFEGFKAKHGFDLPRPKELEDAADITLVKRPAGVIPDDEPWVLAHRYWSHDIFGDMGRRMSAAMRASTGGQGKIGPIPGGMQQPVMMLWSAFYPPLNFGDNGFNLSCFYYYNTFWQPPLAHLWWLECARMNNRGIEQWIMPDCCYEGVDYPAIYEHFGGLMFAGGATGLQYFHYGEMTPGGAEGMTALGGISKRHGLLLAAAKPARKRVGMLVPLETLVWNVESCYKLAYPFLELLLAKCDVEPVCNEELSTEELQRYEAIVLARLTQISSGMVARLAEYANNGGKVIVDADTAKAIQVPGATVLPFAIGSDYFDEYGRAEKIARTREALNAIVQPVADSEEPFVVLRRFQCGDAPFLWVSHAMDQAEFAGMREVFNKPEGAAKARELGYGQVLDVSIRVPDDGRVPVDVYTGKVLKAARAGGICEFTLPLPKWGSRPVAFLPEIPTAVRVSAPAHVKPGGDLPFQIEVRGTQGMLNAVFPLQLTVTDPQGRKSEEYSRRLLASQGRVDHALEFARNDLPGTWTFEFMDTLTATKGSVQVELTPGTGADESRRNQP